MDRRAFLATAAAVQAGCAESADSSDRGKTVTDDDRSEDFQTDGGSYDPRPSARRRPLAV
jgi:hypothetical protein